MKSIEAGRMTLGADVSNLNLETAGAARQGLSIVVPMLNEAAGLARLHDRLESLAVRLGQLFGLRTEVVYVDDGSSDDTYALALDLPARSLDVQVISLSR